MWFYSFFSHPLACLFVTLNHFFRRAKVHNFDEVQRNLGSIWWPQRFSSVFSSRNVIALGFIFRSQIHFWLIFVCGSKDRSKFIIKSSSCSSTICGKRKTEGKDYSFSTESSLQPNENQLTVYVYYFCSIRTPIPRCLDYCNFIMSLEVRFCTSFNFFFHSWLASLSRSFAFPYEF